MDDGELVTQDSPAFNVVDIIASSKNPSLKDALADRAALAPMLAKSTVTQLGKQAGVMRDTATQLRANAVDAATVTGDLMAGMKWAQDAMKAASARLSSDVQDPTSLKSRSMEEFVMRADESRVMLEDIKARKSVSFMDSPMEYISNQLELPKLIEQYNATATQGNAALAKVNAIDTTLTNEAAAAKASMQTLTDASVAAHTRMAANQFAVAANEAEYKALGTQIQANNVIDHGSATQVQALMESYKIDQDAKSMEIREQELKIAKMRVEQFLEDKKDAAQGKMFLRKQINLGRAALGLPQLSEEDMAHVEMMYKDPEGKKKLQPILDRGAAYLYEGRASVGDSPADAFYNLAKVNNLNGFKGKELEPAVNELNKIVQQLQKNPQFDPRKPDSAKPLINQAVADQARRWNNDPDTSPIYKAPTVEVMAQNDIVRNTPWFQTLLGPSLVAAQKSGGNVPAIPAATLYRQTIDAINDGKLNLKDGIEGLTTYYKYATMKNTVALAPVGFPKQTAYNVSLGGLDGTVNMADINQVSNAVMQDFRIQFYDIFPGAKYERPNSPVRQGQ